MGNDAGFPLTNGLLHLLRISVRMKYRTCMKQEVTR